MISDPRDKRNFASLIECVPNISAADHGVVQAVADAIASVQDVWVLHVDISRDVDRSVITFAGTPESVAEAGFQCIREAIERIDLRTHAGVHPRMGAVDVLPFVPMHPCAMDPCVSLARALGRRAAESFQLPVFLYESAASYPDRKNLAAIRKNQFEGLSEKFKDPRWHPDFGPPSPHLSAGAVAIGARPLMIAYNIDLDTNDVRLAKKIAGALRESGRIILNKNRQPLRVLGQFTGCKAIGWTLESRGFAQVSMNLTDFRITPPHRVYEYCRELAANMGTEVAGSEIVGLVPLEAMLQAGRHYLNAHEHSILPEAALVQAAVEGLELNQRHRFDPREKILEYCIRDLVRR